MSVQAARLEDRLKGEGIDAETIPTNPSLPRAINFLQRISVVRTLLRECQYLFSLRRIRRPSDVVHHFSASNLFFFLHTAPLVLMNRGSNNRIIVNYRGGKAQDFLRRWGWIAIPLLRRADQVVVPSDFLRRIFSEHGVSAIVVPNLADTEAFRFYPRQGFSPRLFVSRSLEPMYDVACVLRAFRVVQARFTDAALGVAGDGSEAGRLRQLARELGLRNVTFYGAVPPAKLPLLYRQYDIYVNASRVDNFPGVLIEAACAGLPIVTTQAGGIPEMIRHGENGLLCEVGDAAALAKLVVSILEQPGLGDELASNARSWAERFSWINIFPMLMRCYGFTAEPRGVEFRAEESSVAEPLLSSFTE
jgi:glycosyltransferase involved in cell wall biosynthesis